MTAAEKEAFLSELVKKYPEGVTKEDVKVSSNFTVTRFIVIKDKKATEYKLVKTRGGNYYVKNNNQITEAVFQIETKGYK
jgi:hypothetical protein